MAVVLALLSALAYGVSDFLGGVFSRRSSAWQVGVVGEISAGACTTAVALVASGSPRTSDWCWGALAGLAGGVAVGFLYRGFAGARMNVVAPLSAIGAAVIPVVVGLVTGDRPSAAALAGIACAFPAIVLVSRVEDDDPSHRGGVVDGIAAGVGFGLLFVFLGQVRDGSGFGPVALSQWVALVAVAGTATVLRQRWVPRGPAVRQALWMGPLSAAAVVLFVAATHHGMLAVVSVIAALYPASTVLLASVLLHEKVQRWQAVGLALAVVSVTLVAAS